MMMMVRSFLHINQNLVYSISSARAPAIRAGCTCTLKLSEGTPLSVLALVDLFDQASVPADVVDRITSTNGPGVDEALSSSPQVRKNILHGIDWRRSIGHQYGIGWECTLHHL